MDTFDPFIRLYRAKARRVDWEATRAADRVLVNSKYVRDMVSHIYGIDSLLCYHGIDADVFCPHPDIEQQGYVLSVGAIRPRKGFAFLIESLGSLPRADRPALRLVGNAEEPGYGDHLRDLAERRGVDLQIEVDISQEALVRRYNEAALMAYAPYGEPFGLTPLEAMACGRPVVGVADGGVRETVVNGVTGLLTERDQHQFGEAIVALLRAPRLREAYGRQGRRYVLEQWSWEASVARIERALQAVADGEPWATARKALAGAGC